MVPKLYYNPASPPSRASLLTIKALGIDVELACLNLAEHEHLSANFLKINPFHTVPTLDDDNVIIWDSHAINAYLVEKYGNDDSLYPKNPAKRAKINQILHLNSGILQSRLVSITIAVLRDGARTVAKDKADALVQGYTMLETLLENNKFVSGTEMSIADFSIVTTISSANIVVPIASNRFPKIFDWINRMEALPYYKEANQDGLDLFAVIMKSKILSR